jgi:hypothetical protein
LGTKQFAVRRKRIHRIRIAGLPIGGHGMNGVGACSVLIPGDHVTEMVATPTGLVDPGQRARRYAEYSAEGWSPQLER